MLISTLEIPDTESYSQAKNKPTGSFIVGIYDFEPPLNIQDILTVWWEEIDDHKTPKDQAQLECTVTDKTKEVLPTSQRNILEEKTLHLGLEENDIKKLEKTGLFWIRLFLEVNDNYKPKWQQICMQMHKVNPELKTDLNLG